MAPDPPRAPFLLHNHAPAEEALPFLRKILDTLEFNMSVPTPYIFMRRFLKAAYSDKQEMSCARPGHMSTQEDINEKMRAILIDWLIEVHVLLYKFELMDETLSVTVNIIDRFLEKQVVPRKRLQLVE